MIINHKRLCRKNEAIRLYTSKKQNQNNTCALKLNQNKWHAEISADHLVKLKCAPKFNLIYNDNSKFKIPTLNAYWIDIIIKSQGIEFRHSREQCKTARCILVQKPYRHRQKRDLVQFPNDFLDAGKDVPNSFCMLIVL